MQLNIEGLSAAKRSINQSLAEKHHIGMKKWTVAFLHEQMEWNVSISIGISFLNGPIKIDHPLHYMHGCMHSSMCTNVFSTTTAVILICLLSLYDGPPTCWYAIISVASVVLLHEQGV